MTTKQLDSIEEMKAEIIRAKTLFPGDFHNSHEAYAVLLEEVRELEDVVFWGKKRLLGVVDADIAHKEMIRQEAIQVAAMAIRLASELT